MNKPILFLLFCSALLSSHFLSASASDTLSFSLQEENPKLAQMDSLWSLEQLSAQQLETDTNKLNRWDYTSDSIPFFSDSLIQIRLSKLNEQTPFCHPHRNHLWDNYWGGHARNWPINSVPRRTVFKGLVCHGRTTRDQFDDRGSQQSGRH